MTGTGRRITSTTGRYCIGGRCLKPLAPLASAPSLLRDRAEQHKVLRCAPEANLASIDRSGPRPLTINHGYMVCCGIGCRSHRARVVAGLPSDDSTRTFTLRDEGGHDGEPVRSADCTSRSTAGQARVGPGAGCLYQNE